MDDFDSPKSLAKYLHFLNSNDAAYDEYFLHKSQRMVSNNLLVAYMSKKTINSDNLVVAFERYLCEEDHQSFAMPHYATKVHYDCPLPVNPVTKLHALEDFWTDIYLDSQREANALRRLIDDGVADITLETLLKAIK